MISGEGKAVGGEQKTDDQETQRHGDREGEGERETREKRERERHEAQQKQCSNGGFEPVPG